MGAHQRFRVRAGFWRVYYDLISWTHRAGSLLFLTEGASFRNHGHKAIFLFGVSFTCVFFHRFVCSHRIGICYSMNVWTEETRGGCYTICVTEGELWEQCWCAKEYGTVRIDVCPFMALSMTGRGIPIQARTYLLYGKYQQNSPTKSFNRMQQYPLFPRLAGDYRLPIHR